MNIVFYPAEAFSPALLRALSFHPPFTCLTAPSSPPSPPLTVRSQIRPEEVEVWVVKAITAGLVDGKMSQDQRAVTFSRSVQREFSDMQWKRLKDRMESWVGSVSGMLKTIGSGEATP